ncbi:MAG: hypothetical protein ACK41C_00555 [Phenylobacterium sp.]|jgi:hypothetical protein|uniref:hypothetical protein n=1 Tax=Phenylobacterium sp. TaxID=1871053 RepID=UPI00391C8A3F
MIMTSMRVFPGLFVGRREVICAVEAPQGLAAGEARSAFVCGACEEVMLTDQERADVRDVVVRCRCGEYNQL